MRTSCPEGTAHEPWGHGASRVTDLRLVSGELNLRQVPWETGRGVSSNSGPTPVTATHSEDGDYPSGSWHLFFVSSNQRPSLRSSLHRTSPEYSGLSPVHHLPHCDFPLRSLTVGECVGDHSWLVSSSISLRDEPLVRHFRASSL